MKPTVLVLIGYFLPAYKAGGPVRSIANLIRAVDSQFNFKVITRDRDLGDCKGYDSIATGRWQWYGETEILYLSPKELTISNVAKIVKATSYDLLYLNSILAPHLSIGALLGNRMQRSGAKPIVIAPRGVFSKGALALDTKKKKLYFSALKASTLVRAATWHASSNHESNDINRMFGNVPVLIAPNLFCGADELGVGATGKLSIVFLSRIAPMKNLDFALDVLNKVDSPVLFSIYGPVEDNKYWQLCRQKIESLPKNVCVEVHGPVDGSRVQGILGSHDLLFLPTRGESFGHVIAEALDVGTPVLISDRTPWRNLASFGIGAEYSLDCISDFTNYIECAAKDVAEFRRGGRRRIATNFHKVIQVDRNVRKSVSLFQIALGGHRSVSD